MQSYDATTTPDLDLTRDGVILVRSAVDSELVARLAWQIDRAFEMLKAPQTDLARTIAEGSASWGGIAIDHIEVLAADQPRTRELVSAAIAQLSKVLASASGAVPDYKSGLSYIRRHVSTATFAPWHLDAYAAGTISHDPVFNSWMPLCHVGNRCPSLEFITGAHSRTRAGDYIHQSSGHPADPGYPTAEWVAANSINGRHICFTMKPGDVVIFDHWTPHRTQVADFPPYVRTSAEVRFSTKAPSLLSRLWR